MKRGKYSSCDIAKWFVDRADRSGGEDFTHLKLQKLIYYAQAWFLANHNQALFNEDVQAWPHGPVVPEVWHTYKKYGFTPIPESANKDSKLDKSVSVYLEKIYSAYAKYSAKGLEEFTHKEDPWIKTRGKLPIESKCEKTIDKALIRDYYAKLIDKEWTH
ncbi:MAG: type II toxin-antitoxin system antitoxin SocA domain-containing protein [Pseudomonadota bacterium]